MKASGKTTAQKGPTIRETQLVIAGVGGQGVLFTTKVLAQMALQRRMGVMVSETHGMSQRGGSVVSHLKMGSFHSPLVPRGRADVLYVLQADELYQTATFLRPGGLCFLNTGGTFRPNARLTRYLDAMSIDGHFIDADSQAQKLGSLLLTNLVLLGYSLAFPAMPFRLPNLDKAIRSVSKPVFHEPNLAGARAGHALGVDDIRQQSPK